MVCPRVLVCLLEDHDTSGHGATFSTTFPPTSRRVLLGSDGQCTTARYRYTRRSGQSCRHFLHRNSVGCVANFAQETDR
jgi:hypothetical protein